jgi:hypothetical protein
MHLPCEAQALKAVILGLKLCRGKEGGGVREKWWNNPMHLPDATRATVAELLSPLVQIGEGGAGQPDQFS